MIATAAYFAYREYQRKKEEQEQEVLEGRPEVGQEPVQVDSIIPSSTWFASLPLQETTFNLCQGPYFTSMDHRKDSSERSVINSTSAVNHSAASKRTIIPEPLEANSFKESVRKEWIQAVFGTTFPLRSNDDTEMQIYDSNNQHNGESNLDNKKVLAAWKGVGLAKISSYTSYTIQIDPPSIGKSILESLSVQDVNDEKKEMPSLSSHQNENERNKVYESVDTDERKLGITLSRLALGLYVRFVQPGSEAWCAGIQPDSILVSINDGKINLLAEPTHTALERIWKYEGYGLVANDNSGLSVQEVVASTSADAGSMSAKNYRVFAKQNQVRWLSKTNGTIDSKSPLDQKNETDLAIREPISMTFILHGKLYSVLLLSNPPYGIEWAPCGNFCLVKKVNSERARNAGIQPSSIIAGIYGQSDESFYNTKKGNENTGINFLNGPVCHTIHELDHQLGAAALIDASSKNEPFQIQLCFTPTAARCGHWERQQDLFLEKQDIARNTKQNLSRRNTLHNMRESKTTELKRRLGATVEFDGIQVRFHPILASAAETRHMLSSRRPVTSFDVSLSQMAEKVAAGHLLTIRHDVSCDDYHTWRSKMRNILSSNRIADYFASSTAYQQSGRSIERIKRRSYSMCPCLDAPILDYWNAQQALIYICHFHIKGYNEQHLRMNARNDDHILDFLHNNVSTIESIDFVSTYLLFWIGWMTANKNQPAGLVQHILSLARCQTSPLAHSMEFLAIAFNNTEIKNCLVTMRISNATSLPLRMLTLENQHQVCFDSKEKCFTQTIETKKNENDSTCFSPLNQEGASIRDVDAAQDTILYKISSQSDSKSLFDSDRKTLIEKPPKRIFRIFRKRKHTNAKSKALEVKRDAGTIYSSQQEAALESSMFNEAAHLKTLTVLANKSSISAQPNTPASRITKRTSSPESADSHNTATASKNALYANFSQFLKELELVCQDIEKALMQSFSQKFARWALQPWTPNKGTALAQVTHDMRERLKRYNQKESLLPLVNPIGSSLASFDSIDTDGCYILPSAHFPLLLTFDCLRKTNKHTVLTAQRMRQESHRNFGEELLYRTVIELVELNGCRNRKQGKLSRRSFSIHASISGSIVKSECSIGIDRDSNHHVWDTGNILVFDSRSSWGPPKTLSLLVSEAKLDHDGKEQISSSDPTSGKLLFQKECGYCWVDLVPFWRETENGEKFRSNRVTHRARVVAPDEFEHFDEHGELPESRVQTTLLEPIEIEIRLTTSIIDTKGKAKCSLLYKHDDDIRQEMFAIEFIKSCDRVLRSCGLDMKMLTFRSIPAGRRRGFIEWIQGSVPLSEICQSCSGTISDRQKKEKQSVSMLDASVGANFSQDHEMDDNTLSSVAKAGLTKYESLNRIRLEAGRAESDPKREIGRTGSSVPVNPIQDFLRSFAFDANCPYRIKKGVMDNYVKSCAGYCVCSYLLGVGDRHLDNLLIHPSGHFFHCDYSFILGNDPKKYFPMRITEDMINGMGGRKSDNYCQFLSLTCAAYLTLRRPENVRLLLSLVRLLEGCGLPDLEETQSLETAIQGIRDRMRLDLNDSDAISYMEKLIEDSCSSRMWIAVDAIHSLAQHF